MARIRTIKPEFWTSGQVLECSTNARLLFIGLWNFCDDAGRHADKPKQVKAEVFPADDFTNADVVAMLDELERSGLIRRYAVDGEGYFLVTGWHHQRIDKAQSPKYPGPIEERSGSNPRTLPPDTIRYDTKGDDRSRAREPRAADAAPEDRTRQANLVRDIGRRLCAVAGIDPDDPRWFGDFGCISAWMGQGADPDLDILPAAEAVMAKRRKTDPAFVPKSLAYFREAVDEARRRRTEGAPSTNGLSPTGGYGWEPKPENPPALRAQLRAIERKDRETAKRMHGLLTSKDPTADSEAVKYLAEHGEPRAA